MAAKKETEKYNTLKKIIPDLDFDKFTKFQPTVRILQKFYDFLDGWTVEKSLLREVSIIKNRWRKRDNWMHDCIGLELNLFFGSCMYPYNFKTGRDYLHKKLYEFKNLQISNR